MSTIITISNDDRKEYFFTTDHCQKGLGSSWVPVTYKVPGHVVPRASLPTGIVNDKEDYKKIFHQDYKEIPNPDPEYQA